MFVGGLAFFRDRSWLFRESSFVLRSLRFCISFSFPQKVEFDSVIGQDIPFSNGFMFRRFIDISFFKHIVLKFGPSSFVIIGDDNESMLLV